MQNPIQRNVQALHNIQHKYNQKKSLTKNISGLLMNADWFDIVEKYKKLKQNNQKGIVAPEKELKLLGALREYIVDLLFNQYNVSGNNYYFAFGSNNILSDYDITIVGLDACDIAKNIYNHYFEEIKKPMAISFDTNIYCAGFYFYDALNINPSIQDNIVIFQETQKNIQLFNFQPITPEQKKISLYFTFIKLLGIETGNNFYKTIQGESNILRNELGVPSSLEDSYEKMFESAEILFRQIYNKNDDRNDEIYKNVCTTQYYSIESYYTPCTVNVVVLEMQAKKNIHLNYFNYVISILENLGDLLQHWKEHPDFIKISKYIYRIYYGFQKLGIYDNVSELKRVEESVANRGNSNAFDSSPFFTYINSPHSDNYELIEEIQKISFKKLEPLIKSAIN